MSWEECSVEDRRRECVGLAGTEGANLSALASRFGVSRKTLYKWKSRAAGGEAPWWEDRSRRPHTSPARVSDELEQAVLEVREAHPMWGARKILHVLESSGRDLKLAAASTVCAILRRHGKIAAEESAKRREFVHFEHEAPNDVWQMDYKGDFSTRGGRCHPLTIVDDHSRYAVAVRALRDESSEVTREAMIDVFHCYGLPRSVLVDNGSCWGRKEGYYSDFALWLVRLGIDIIYSRPRHPQTRGKNERFNRTLKEEVIQGRLFANFVECQREFDAFRRVYNTVRPHEALAMAVPASRYRLSERPYPHRLASPEYLSSDTIVRVRASGLIVVDKERYHLGQALRGERVALRPTEVDGIYDVYYYRRRIGVINRMHKQCYLR